MPCGYDLRGDTDDHKNGAQDRASHRPSLSPGLEIERWRVICSAVSSIRALLALTAERPALDG
jgi:hypothetical protein